VEGKVRELVDIHVGGWTVEEAQAFQRVAGVNPIYAVGLVQRAAVEAGEERKRLYGDEEPPEGYLPLPMFSIDPGVMLAFAWITWRRAEPTLKFKNLADELDMNELMGAFYDAFTAMLGEDDEAPLPTTMEPETSAPSSPGSTSAPSTGGDSETSEP